MYKDFMYTLEITPPPEIVSKLKELLENKVTVNITWFGKKVVSIEGYAGAAEIDKIATLFLEFCHLDISYKGRLEAYHVWGKIQQLYKESIEAVRKTYIIGILTIAMDNEKLMDPNHPMIRITGLKEDPRELELFDYNSEIFKKIWPDKNPIQITGSACQTWIASKKMIEEKIEPKQEF